MQIGEQIKAARESAGLTVFELARKSGVTPAQIHNIEAGRTKRPREATKRVLFKALRIESSARRSAA